MAGLWRNNKKTPEGKYLVKRRDGSVPKWPSFVIGAKDPNAPAALRAYADEAEQNGMDPEYVKDIYRLADEFNAYRIMVGEGFPDSGPDVVDDPATVKDMRQGKSA